MPVRLPVEVVSDGLAEGLELSVGDPDGPGEELSVGVEVGVVLVGVAVGDVWVGVADGDDVPVSVGVAVADGLAVGLGVLDGVADGQAGAVAG